MGRRCNARIRLQACKLAAKVMQAHDPDYALAPHVWSACVFFEMYLHQGSAGTAKDFGPKKPAKFKVVR